MELELKLALNVGWKCAEMMCLAQGRLKRVWKPTMPNSTQASVLPELEQELLRSFVLSDTTLGGSVPQST